MRKASISIVAAIVGVVSWVTNLILNYCAGIFTISILYPFGLVLAGYNLISGIVSLVMLIMAARAYIKNKNIKLLILNTIINGSYLVIYFKMIYLISSN